MKRAAKRWITALALGLLFGLGLGISGMTQPDKVLAFLDLTGAWDPSLALVMVAAIGAFAVVFRIARRRPAPLLGGRFPRLPKRPDGRLLGGAALFGLGWGLAGICPGPALVDLGAGLGDVAVFSAAMVGGILLHRLVGAGVSGQAPPDRVAPAPEAVPGVIRQGVR
ncbi:MAG: hypothetical protein CVU56_21395 [Deltaproteobacteria bacterium HGW-Deltaproteobacteria-14]|jgi:hypothetical protein|nr:MAG: hypothetical protein CVU56_21395 [Deltaproteobacteria bacterium HGW-Deltaproteobacteria-14]